MLPYKDNNTETPAVDGLGVGAHSCCAQDFRSQIRRRATKRLHHRPCIDEL